MEGNIPLNIVVIIICCGALWKGACWLVEAAARLAKWLGISELIIGLTVVAFGTSAPEFAVTVNAALRGLEDISVGNVVGSNIFNIGFILGGCAIVGDIKTGRALVLRDGIFLLVITAALVGFSVGGHLGRWEGAAMFLGLLAYLVYLFAKRESLLEEEIPQGKATWRDIPLLLLGLGLIIAGGHYLVWAAKAVAGDMGLPDLVVGLTIVAAGTSVPEFAISLVAILKKHHGISAGNLIGSNIFNTLGVLGVAGALRPLTVDRFAFESMIMLVGLTGLVVIFMRTGWRLFRIEGVILVLLSLAIWIYIIWMSLNNITT